MSSGIAHIVIRHDTAAEVMLAGLPLLSRLILAALNGAANGEVKPLVTVAGEGNAAYRQAVEAVVAQVAPDTRINWLEALPDLSSQGLVLVVQTSGLFTSDLVELLVKAAGSGNAVAGGEDFDGLWLLNQEGYSALVKNQPVKAERIAATPENFCPVYDGPSLLLSEKWLFKRFGKSTDGVISRYLNRPVSTWVSRRLVHTSLTPNILTWLTAAFAFLMFAVLLSGTPMALAMGCLLYHVTSIVDGFDGEVARAKFLSTRRGASFDTAVDMATNILFIIGLTIGLSKVYGPHYLLLGGMVAVIALVGIASMTYVVWKGPKGGSFDVLQLTIRRRIAGWPVVMRMFEVLNTIMKRDFFALFFGLLGVAGFAYTIPWLLAVGMIAWLFAIVLAAPSVIGANPSDILPDHIGPLAAPKNPQASGQSGK